MLSFPGSMPCPAIFYFWGRLQKKSLLPEYAVILARVHCQWHPSGPFPSHYSLSPAPP